MAKNETTKPAEHPMVAEFDLMLKEMLAAYAANPIKLAAVRREWARWRKAKRQGTSFEDLVHLATVITDTLTGTTLDQYRAEVAQRREGDLT